MDKRFSRTRLLIGGKAAEKLAASSVAVFGLGGVGSFAVEALARAGVGRLRLVDFDVVKHSNFNRQLLAVEAAVGKKKVELAAERIAQINPEAIVEIKDVFADEAAIPGLLATPLNVAIDAIDSLSCKVALLSAAVERGCPVISCMGASTRLDPFSVRAGDLSDTEICPLARNVRKRLHRKRIYSGIRCVYSIEPADTRSVSETAEPETYARGRVRPSLGSISYMPAIFGLIAAQEAIKMIVGPKAASI